jgi:hypothetical protein
MATTDVNQVSEQVQKKWAGLFMKELRESLLLGGLVNKQYEGSIGQEGDTVYVSQINAPTGQLRTVGTDADVFDSALLSTTRISVVANKRAVAAFEIAELAKLQSQLDSQDSEIRESLKFAMAQQVNDYLFSLVSPSTSSPDHLINSVSDFNAAQVSSARLRASVAKWPDQGRAILCDPTYYSDLLNATTLTSTDYGSSDAPVIGGKLALKRFGFDIYEDNSMVTDSALVFHPDFMHLVTQMQPRFKLSDLHGQKKFGYLLSVDMIFGASLGIAGANKHQVVVAAASGSVIH